MSTFPMFFAVNLFGSVITIADTSVPLFDLRRL
jgi:hypothetical protein